MTAIDDESEASDERRALLSGLDADCCVVGGGPSGMMTGLMLARAGVNVVVLEKYRDFSRDFRGDTMHPSTLEVLSEMGLLDTFLKHPHTELRELTGDIGGRYVRLADFSALKIQAPFIAFMPQWKFLEFIEQEAQKLPNFRMLRESPASSLVFSEGRVIGVRAATPGGPLEVRARVVVAADGRDSQMRAQSGLPLREYPAEVDVVWFRLSREATDRHVSLGHVGRGQVLLMLNRGDFWQCALIVEKGSVVRHDHEGVEALRERLASIVPLAKERLNELDDGDKIKILKVQVNRLKRWATPGLLCIGDAAHAMSPVGGVGITLAVQDAVAAARVLNPLLRVGTTPSLRQLRKIERRRSFATHLTIRLQLLVQSGLLNGVLHDSEGRVPLFATLLHRSRLLRRLVAHVIGMGLRPEHVPPSAAH